MGLKDILIAVKLDGKNAFLNLEIILEVMTATELEDNDEIIKQCRDDVLFVSETEKGEFGGALDEELEDAQKRLLQNTFQLFLEVRERLEVIVQRGEHISLRNFLEEKAREKKPQLNS